MPQLRISITSFVGYVLVNDSFIYIYVITCIHAMNICVCILEICNDCLSRKNLGGHPHIFVRMV